MILVVIHSMIMTHYQSGDLMIPWKNDWVDSMLIDERTGGGSASHTEDIMFIEEGTKLIYWATLWYRHLITV